MDRLHAHRSGIDVVWCFSPALAGMVRLRGPSRRHHLGLARADHRAPRPLASGKPISAHPHIDNLRASTVMGPAARLPNRQAVHHAGFDYPRTGRRFQAVPKAPALYTAQSLSKRLLPMPRQAASWGIAPLTHRNRSTSRGDTEGSPRGKQLENLKEAFQVGSTSVIAT